MIMLLLDKVLHCMCVVCMMCVCAVYVCTVCLLFSQLTHLFEGR